MIEIQRLSKSFRWHRVLVDLDLLVEPGCILAVFGPNGSGKTTLIRIISTLLRPDGGKVKVEGHDIDKEPEWVRKSIGVVSHDSYLYDELTGLENLIFYGRLFGLSKHEAKRETKELLDTLDLVRWKNEPVSSYSRGMKQRLSIGRALLHDPPVLLLDEPFTGLDLSSVDRLIDTLKQLARMDRTILMTTHDLKVGHLIADEFAILVRGRIERRGRLNTIGQDELVSIYRQLTDARGGRGG